MRIALVIRGQNYLRTESSIVNYKESVKNFYATIINPYRNASNEVDIFLLTYESAKIVELHDDYNPVKSLVLADSERTSHITLRQHLWHYASRELIVSYEQEKNIHYDLVINTRFDITFIREIPKMNIDYTKMNIAFAHSSGNCDDNLFIFPRDMLEEFQASWKQMLEDKALTHTFCHYFPKEKIHYLSEVSDEEWEASLGDKIFRLTRKRIE